MFPDIHIPSILLINPIPLKSRIRHIFLIHTPANIPLLKQISDRLHMTRDAKVPVFPDPVRGSAYGRDVVGLAGVCDGVVVG